MCLRECFCIRVCMCAYVCVRVCVWFGLNIFWSGKLKLVTSQKKCAKDSQLLL